MEDKDFLATVVKALVENPNDVEVKRDIDERGVLLTLKVNPADMGKIIGKQGQTAKALRTLLRIVGNNNNARVNLKIFEPEGMRSHDRENRDENMASSEQAPSATEDVEELSL
ncbi:KH domain-containing protein [Candidatus Nomurabacteria bacterium]|nr:KH domain-containing protein [Candidatus Nomurabacteria bacterium]